MSNKKWFELVYTRSQIAFLIFEIAIRGMLLYVVITLEFIIESMIKWSLYYLGSSFNKGGYIRRSII